MTKKATTKKPVTRKKPSHTKAKATKKKKRRKPKMGLSEAFSHQGLKKSAKAAGGGFLGGAGFAVVDTLLDQAMEDGAVRELTRFGTAAVLSIISGAVLDAPNIAAGVGGAYGQRIVQQVAGKMLSEMENEDYADEDSLEEYPDALDENGTPMYLADDGGFYYLEEFELADGSGGQPYALAESFQANDMYPRYVNSAAY